MRQLFLRGLTAILLCAGCGGDGGEGGGGSGSGGDGGPDPFDDNVVATFDITMSQADWTAMTSNLEDNTWRRATVAWRGETYPDVAIHPAGQSSRDPAFGNPNKPSMWLNFNEFVPGREFHKFERIKLDGLSDDPAMIRERIAYAIYAARGVPAPRVAHCRVNVNGVYRGLYLVEERVNKEFVTKRFGNTVVNQLYRWTEWRQDLDWQPAAPDSFYATVPPEGQTAQSMWEGRIETIGAGGAEVKNLVDLINNNPAAAGSVFDVDSFLNWMAVEVATGETDGYVGSSFIRPGVGDPNDFYTGNVFMYKVPGSNLFRWIVWDRDQSFWREASITFGFDRRIVTQRIILDVPGNLDRYKQLLRETLNGAALPSVLEARFDFIRSQIESHAFEDPFKRQTNQELIWEWDDLRRFFQERYNALTSQL